MHIKIPVRNGPDYCDIISKYIFITVVVVVVVVVLVIFLVGVVIFEVIKGTTKDLMDAK